MIGSATGPAPVPPAVVPSSGGPSCDVAAETTPAVDAAPNRSAGVPKADPNPVGQEGASTASRPAADFAALLAVKEAVETSMRPPVPAVEPREADPPASSTPDEVLALLAGSLAIPAVPQAPAASAGPEPAGPSRLTGSALPPAGLPPTPAGAGAPLPAVLHEAVPEGPANGATGIASGLLPPTDGVHIEATAPGNGAAGFDSLLQPVAPMQPAATGTTASGGAAPAAPLALPADPDAGFDDGFGARIAWMAEQRIGHAEIRLNPDNLGPIDVRVQLDGTRVNAEFHSAHVEVRQALEASVPRLRELLGHHGLQLGQADVGQRQAGSGAASHGHGTANPEAEASAPLASPVRSRSRGLVDEYA